MQRDWYHSGVSCYRPTMYLFAGWLETRHHAYNSTNILIPLQMNYVHVCIKSLPKLCQNQSQYLSKTFDSSVDI